MIKGILLFIWEIVKISLIALLIVIPIRVFVFQPFFVRGASMEPAFHNYDYLIVDQISYRFSDPQRGDVVVFSNPSNPSERFIKRIVGLPNETLKLEDGNIFIESEGEFFQLDETDYLGEYQHTTGSEVATLGEKEYFVLGDNRSFSYDSRVFGVIKEENIIGKFGIRLWPLGAFARE